MWLSSDEDVATVTQGGMVQGIGKGEVTISILSDDGEAAPYNGEPEYSINTEKAEKIGYHFSNLKEWIYQLLDYYIEKVNMGN